MTMEHMQVPHLLKMFKGEMLLTPLEMFKSEWPSVGGFIEEIQALDGMPDKVVFKTLYNPKFCAYLFLT